MDIHASYETRRALSLAVQVPGWHPELGTGRELAAGKAGKGSTVERPLRRQFGQGYLGSGKQDESPTPMKLSQTRCSPMPPDAWA